MASSGIGEEERADNVIGAFVELFGHQKFEVWEAERFPRGGPELGDEGVDV